MEFKNFLFVVCLLLPQFYNEISCKTIKKRSISSHVECGVAKTVALDFIFGTGSISPKQHPWKAVIFKNENGKWKYICGGVLIDHSSVITAAHCLHDREYTTKASELRVILGCHNLNQTDEENRQTINVEEIKINEDWDPFAPTFSGDIAHLRLANSVKYDDYTRSICLPKTEVLDVKNGDVVGWGVVDDYNTISDTPKEVNLPIVNTIECLQREPGLLQVAWKDSFCAGRPSVGVCRGDSGSGFYVEKDGKFYLRGIVSSAINKKCSQTNLAIYTDIYKYLGFINGILQSYNNQLDGDRVTINVLGDKKEIIVKSVQMSCASRTCYVDNLNIIEPNIWFKTITTKHEDAENDRDIKRIYYRNSNFSYLPNFVTQRLESKFPNATILVLYGSKVHVNLGEESYIYFKQFDKIEFVHFGDNLKKLSKNMFTNAAEMRQFYANNNGIEEIPEDIFRLNHKLHNVNMDSNKISSVPENLFATNYQMKYISFSNNRLTFLPPNFLDHTGLLIEFRAERNQIKEYSPKLKANKPNLEKFST